MQKPPNLRSSKDNVMAHRLSDSCICEIRWNSFAVMNSVIIKKKMLAHYWKKNFLKRSTEYIYYNSSHRMKCFLKVEYRTFTINRHHTGTPAVQIKTNVHAARSLKLAEKQEAASEHTQVNGWDYVTRLC